MVVRPRLVQFFFLHKQGKNFRGCGRSSHGGRLTAALDPVLSVGWVGAGVGRRLSFRRRLVFTFMVSLAIPIVSKYPVVGFSGSRSASSCPASLPGQLAAALPTSVAVFVGCQQGVDAAVRAASYSPTIFKASSYGTGSWAYAARSAALVRSLARQGGVLVAFPSGPCPGEVKVSSQFRGYGSGTWGSVALALGLGVPVLLQAPLPASANPSWQAWCSSLAGRFSLVGGVGGRCWLWAG